MKELKADLFFETSAENGENLEFVYQIYFTFQAFIETAKLVNFRMSENEEFRNMI